MACWTTYRLKPKPGAGFHFGLRGLEGEESAAYCPSDTLFSALVATAADVGGSETADAFAAPFAAGKPPSSRLRLSEATSGYRRQTNIRPA